MNKQIFATLLVLALATAVVAKRPAFIQVKPAVMKHVRETPVSRSTDILSKFHSTLTLVQTSQDAAEGNVLQEWISDFRQSVVEEGIAHANIHAEQVQDCADEIPFRKKEINDATVSKQNAKVQYAACVQDQGLTNSLAQVNTAAQQKYNADLDNAREERIRQNSLYKTRVKAHDEAEVTIGEAIVIVDQFATTVHTGANYNAFVQLGKKVNALLMTSMKTGHVRLVTPITTMFLQTKQNAFDPEVIDRLRALFEELLANVQSSLGQLHGDEDNAASAFAQYEAHLTGLIDKLEAEEEELEFHGVEMARCIETEANVAVAAENKIDRNVDLLQKAEVLCASYEAQWEAAESSRAGQLKMIDALGRAAEQIQQIYPNKFKSLGAALQNAGDVFNTETDQYNDSDPFEEYRQAGTALKVGA